jgi:primosomal protein N' (replication factor Y)
VVRVALDVPLDERFDFRVPEGLDVPIGALVVVPFGRTRKVGVAVERAATSSVPAARLRDVEAVVADVAPLKAEELELYEFCAAYYQRPLGEVIAASLPPRCARCSRRRSGRRRSPARAASRRRPHGRPAGAVERCGRARSLPSRAAAGHHRQRQDGGLPAPHRRRGRARPPGAAARPEIGLTPQFEAQVRARFPGVRLASAHSHLRRASGRGLAEAQSGAARIVLGTRLAVLLPFSDLGLIVVDEEHDGSYKQQEGLRYSARDVAVRRAQRLGIPVVLGSATPSLESVANALEAATRRVRLDRRVVAGATLPAVRTIDTRADRPVEGVSDALLRAMRERLARGEQSLVFVNRRGFAPVLFCRNCDWHSECTRCSANMVLHRREAELRCHHCGPAREAAGVLPNCGGRELEPIGQGTQRIEESLRTRSRGRAIAPWTATPPPARASSGACSSRCVRETSTCSWARRCSRKATTTRPSPWWESSAPTTRSSAPTSRAAERLHAQLVQVAGRAGRAASPARS